MSTMRNKNAITRLSILFTVKVSENGLLIQRTSLDVDICLYFAFDTLYCNIRFNHLLSFKFETLLKLCRYCFEDAMFP